MKNVSYQNVKANNDEPDYRAILSVLNSSAEFKKIGETHQEHLVLCLKKSPKFLRAGIDYVVSNYKKDSIEIDGDLIFKQIMEVWWEDTIPKKRKSNVNWTWPLKKAKKILKKL